MVGLGFRPRHENWICCTVGICNTVSHSVQLDMVGVNVEFIYPDQYRITGFAAGYFQLLSNLPVDMRWCTP